jgi:hypothetical protein
MLGMYVSLYLKIVTKNHIPKRKVSTNKKWIVLEWNCSSCTICTLGLQTKIYIYHIKNCHVITLVPITHIVLSY